MIVIVDLGLGNLFSICRAFDHVGESAVVTDNIESIMAADKIVLSGVGSFKTGMYNIHSKGLAEVIIHFAESGKPILGVCLGMQLLMEYSEENGGVMGLGVIPGRVRYLQNIDGFLPKFKVPNVGWNTIIKGDSDWAGTVLDKVSSYDEFYFVHSLCVVTEDKYQLSSSSYGGIAFTSVVKNGNVTGCQFHPETSGELGLSIVEKFATGGV